MITCITILVAVFEMLFGQQWNGSGLPVAGPRAAGELRERRSIVLVFLKEVGIQFPTSPVPPESRWYAVTKSGHLVISFPFEFGTWLFDKSGKPVQEYRDSREKVSLSGPVSIDEMGDVYCYSVKYHILYRFTGSGRIISKTHVGSAPYSISCSKKQWLIVSNSYADDRSNCVLSIEQPSLKVSRIFCRPSEPFALQFISLFQGYPIYINGLDKEILQLTRNGQTTLLVRIAGSPTGLWTSRETVICTSLDENNGTEELLLWKADMERPVRIPIKAPLLCVDRDGRFYFLSDRMKRGSTSGKIAIYELRSSD